MSNSKLIVLLQLICMFFLAVGGAIAEENGHIGKVKTVKSIAHIVRNDSIITISPGTKFFTHDILTTGKGGAMGVMFVDGAILTLGPESEFMVSEYVFSPIENSNAFISTMKRGAASYISGAIGRINPESVKIETPTAYLGLRGTKILINID